MERNLISTQLGYTDRFSDKVYIVILRPSSVQDMWDVVGNYGRRGDVNRTSRILMAVPYGQAYATYEKKIRNELRKGYRKEY